MVLILYSQWKDWAPVINSPGLCSIGWRVNVTSLCAYIQQVKMSPLFQSHFFQPIFLTNPSHMSPCT